MVVVVVAEARFNVSGSRCGFVVGVDQELAVLEGDGAASQADRGLIPKLVPADITQSQPPLNTGSRYSSRISPDWVASS